MSIVLQLFSSGSALALPPLMSLAEIRAFDVNQETSTPVDFVGTVTYADSVYFFLFVQDGPNAIFVYGNPNSNLKPGDVVRVQGTLRKGDLSPVVQARWVDKQSSADLPDAEVFDLFGPRIEQDCKIVTTECVVLQAFVEPQDALLYCRELKNTFYIQVGAWGLDTKQIQGLVGRRIRCTGPLGLQMKEQDAFEIPGQSAQRILGRKIFCSSLDSIELLDDQANETKSTYSDIKSILWMSADLPTSRFGTHGQVSLVEDGDRPAIIIFDPHGAIKIECESVVDLLPGMVLRVAGERRVHADNGEVTFHADCLHLLVHSRLDVPPSQNVAEAIENWESNRRIAVEGLPYRRRGGDESWFQLVDGRKRIDVHVVDERFDGSAFDPESANRLRVVGVASAAKRDGSTASFQVSVASAEDLTIVEGRIASAKNALIAMACCLFALVMSMIWVRTLRASVAEKTKVASTVTANLRSSYEAIDDGVLAVDSDFCTLAVNREFQRITRTNLEIGEPAHKLENAIASRLEDSNEFRYAWRVWTKNGHSNSAIDLEFTQPDRRAIVVRTSPIKLPNSETPIGRLFVLCDETEKRRLEAEVRHSNKLEAVGRMAGGVAHDFNNVLMAITANLTIARFNDAATVGDVRHELSVAEDAAFRGADIVRRLLTFASKNNFEFEAISINSIVQRLDELMRHSFDASFDFEFSLDPQNPVVKVDSTAIEQVLLNLYVNSKDAMPGGGKISTTTKVVRNPATNEDVVLISVCDNGIGIPDEIGDKVFEPFFTTKGQEHGTGLGLSVSYRVIQQHNGSIHYVPRKEGGCEFQVILPVHQGAAGNPVGVDNIDRGDGTILVVDDEDVVRSVAETMLHRFGYKTVAAKNGEQALAIVADPTRNIECVLLDLTMPGIPGREVLRILKREHPYLPVVLCSGYLMSGESNPANDGPDAEIQKPYSMKQLVSTVNEVLSHTRASANWRDEVA